MLRPFLILLLAELISFGIFAPQMGFYYDDWTNLERCSQAGSLASAIKVYSKLKMERPVEMLQYPLFFALGGFNPAIYQLLFLVLETIGGFLLFLLLDRLLGRRELALLAAALVLVFPNHGVTHHWFASSAWLVSIDLLLAGMLAHLRWLGSRGTGWLGASLACYLLSFLNYEAAAFLPLLLAGALAARRARGTAKDMFPYAAALAAALIWQRLAVGFWAHNPRPIALSPLRFWEVYSSALSGLTVHLAGFCSSAAALGLREFPLDLLALAGAASLGGAWLLCVKGKAQDGPDAALKIGLAAGTAGFIGAYLPYALSQHYTPTLQGVLSRVNAGGAIPGGLLLACALAYLPWPRARRVILGAILCAFTLTNWHVSRQWAESWRIQRTILSRITNHIAGLPPSSSVILAGAPRYLDDGLAYALVFAAEWDFSAALRLTTGRKDLVGNVFSPRLRFEKDAVAEQVDPETVARRSYANLYLYRFDLDSMTPLRGPQGALAMAGPCQPPLSLQY